MRSPIEPGLFKPSVYVMCVVCFTETSDTHRGTERNQDSVQYSSFVLSYMPFRRECGAQRCEPMSWADRQPRRASLAERMLFLPGSPSLTFFFVVYT